MACVSRSVMSIAAANSSSFSFKTHHLSRRFDASKLRIRASSNDTEDCNDVECAPDKEVGKISVEWLAGEKTKVVGTFPPKKKGWTGYIEKDTAGQTNIYSVEPTVYVAESVLSSGNAGSSSDGAENTAAIAAGLGLIAVAAASSILLQVGKNSPQIQPTVYSGPSLGYYISKFKPEEVIQASVPSQIEIPAPAETPTETETSVPEVPQAPDEAVQASSQVEPSESNVETATVP